VNLPFWKNKRVFVTGHSGFKGGWLTAWLVRLGAQVTGYSLAPPSEPSLFEQIGIDRGIRSHLGDIRDAENLSAALEEAKPEIVLHLAAQALVRRGYREPLETYSTNVMGTAQLLQLLRTRPEVRAVVSVTSDKCYRNREWLKGYAEDDPLGGKDPYSSSKAAAELVTAAFRDSYFSGNAAVAQVATARAGNVIGGGDWAEDRLVPDLVRGFGGSRPVSIRCPEAVRPWQHVLEPLRGYLMLAERLWKGESAFATAWNFGPDAEDERTVRWVADRLASLWSGGARWQIDSEQHPPEATYLKLETSRARDRLGWKPQLPLEEALKWIVDWHRGAHEGEDLRALTEHQIQIYEKTLSVNA
jgi:CDP-glucose 4,6-dehydratase